MSKFNIQADAINVERIMEQIRDLIKEKRGEDYTEAQIREMANVKLERFLDPKKVRSDLVEHYRRQQRGKQDAFVVPDKLLQPPAAPPSFEFDPDIIYRSSRGLPGRLLHTIRRLLNPVLKFFFNPAPIVHALHVQREINERQNEAINWMVQTQAEFIDRLVRLFDLSSSRLAAREEIDALNYEVLNNLVVEMTRLSIEMKNHRMRVESIAGRLDFDERRARALEGVVQYREGGGAPGKPGVEAATTEEAPEGASRRRRRRRGRKRSSSASVAPVAATGGATPSESAAASPRPEPDRETASPSEETATLGEIRSPAGEAAEPLGETSRSSSEAPDPAGKEGPPPDVSGSADGTTDPPSDETGTLKP